MVKLFASAALGQKSMLAEVGVACNDDSVLNAGMKQLFILMTGVFISACGTYPKAPALSYRSGDQLSESDRLGYQISDPAMRKKILELYKRQDVVVEQVVIR